MRSKRRFVELVSVIAAALLVTVMANLVGASSGSGSAPVTVQNTPLPITMGNEALTIGGTVNAAQAGTWNVGLSGTASVQFSPEEFFQRGRGTGFLVGDIVAGDTISVPSGKRLVIEYITARIRVPTGQSVRLTLTLDTSSPSSIHYYFPAVAEGSFFGQDSFGVTEHLRLYAEEEVTLFAERSGSIGIGNFEFAISGYLISE